MKLPGFYESLVSLNGDQFINPTQERRRQRIGDDESDDENGDSWKPFWRRGNKAVKDVSDALKPAKASGPPTNSNSKNNKPGSSKTKLYHSTLDLTDAGIVKKKVKMSKSVSMQGLHRSGDGADARRESKRSSHRNSSLNLPRIEPEVDFSGESKSRGSSATTTHKSSSLGARSHSRYGGESEAESEVEEDVYLSDEDPEISRRNLDKAGDYIVEHDWILKEELAKEARKVNALHKKVQIILPDEDPLEPLKSRVEEITLMINPRPEHDNFFESLDPEQRKRIMKYKDLDHEELIRQKRKRWTAAQHFQDAARKVLMIHRACHPRRRYLSDDKPDTAPDSVKKIKQTTKSDKETVQKSSLNLDMHMSLITQAEYRNSEDIKRVIWMLKATKAFKNLFPSQLEEQLAKVVAYEQYDDKRVIAQQGRNCERFYHILTGKLIKVKEYRLLSGVINREEGSVEKGNTTDPEEMINKWPREHNLVTKGNVEVFVIDRKDFIELLHTCKGPPIDFLQKLDLFKEFPCDTFLQSPDAIDFRYYGQEALVVQDTNRTPWLHVVKTGQVKVIRQQNVIDVANEDKFSGQPTEELGCVRPFSHARAMLGLLASQRRMKTVVGAISFPEIMSRPTLERSNTDQFALMDKLKRVEKDKRFDNPITRRHRPSLVNIQVSENGTPSPRTPKRKQKEESGRESGGQSSQRLEDIHEGSEMGASSSVRMSDTSKMVSVTPRLQSGAMTNGDVSPSKDSSSRRSGEKNVLLPPINGGSKKAEKENGELVPHGTYLTREKTEFDQVYNGKQKKDVIQRRTYLQLDVLRPGDIFGLNEIAAQFRSMYPLHDKFGGLEHMEPQALASEAPGVSLISNGAEIIKISKRFFLQHAQNNTMLKVETMQREYMDSEEAKEKMYDKETWRQYKTTLLQRTVDNLNRNQIEKVP